MNEPFDTNETVSTGASGAGTPSLDATADPARIGRYRVLRRLCQGGFGRVYLAHDDELDRPVAIKVPDPARLSGPEGAAAYLAEARTVAGLDHPAIVPVYDAGRTDDGLCYAVSKFVSGSDLAARMAGPPLSFREAAGLVTTVADALHHAHKRGVVHRDVKPGNILLDTTGGPLLADFGLALRDEDHGRAGPVAGSPAYMSPEQVRGDGHLVDGRSDIFSLGVVLYELLTRRRPFRGNTTGELLDDILRAEARPPRQIDDAIPPELERICLKALAKRPSERYTTALDLADDLRRWAGPGGPEQGSPPRAEDARDGPPGTPSARPILQIAAAFGGPKGCLLNIAVCSATMLLFVAYLGTWFMQRNLDPSSKSEKSNFTWKKTGAGEAHSKEVASEAPLLSQAAPRPRAALKKSRAPAKRESKPTARIEQARLSYELGDRLLAQGDSQYAVHEFTEAIRVLDEGWDDGRALAVRCYVGRARAHGLLNMPDRAIADLWRAHELDPRVFFQDWERGR
jgi:serine/threonine protein kinase